MAGRFPNPISPIWLKSPWLMQGCPSTTIQNILPLQCPIWVADNRRNRVNFNKRSRSKCSKSKCSKNKCNRSKCSSRSSNKCNDNRCNSNRTSRCNVAVADPFSTTIWPLRLKEEEVQNRWRRHRSLDSWQVNHLCFVYCRALQVAAEAAWLRTIGAQVFRTMEAMVRPIPWHRCPP